jgi:hypothetical protein
LFDKTTKDTNMNLKSSITCLIFTLMLISVFVGCKKDDLPAKPKPSPFNAAVKGSASIPVTGGTGTILITAGANGWWVVVPDDKKSWCSVARFYGSGDFELPVSFKPNLTGQDRTVQVKINATFDLPAVNLLFTQASN